MEFNLPTTKTQMYQVLNDIFYYYRIQREGYEEVALQELNLERLIYNLPNQADIANEAKILLSPEQKRELMQYNNALKRELKEIENKLLAVENSCEQEILQVNTLYEESENKIYTQAINAGLIGSSVVIDKTAQLEESKNQKISTITTNKNKTLIELNAQKVAIQQLLDSSDADFEPVFTADVAKKIKQLTGDAYQIEREVFKYNNGLDEKEQRYANGIKQTKASLRLRFLDIRSGQYTKDQLVEMGYYEDVIRCVCGYYDTLDASTAYQDISHESKLAIYLDDYYQNIVYLYKVNAGF